jgi:hypothetical protein
MRTKHRRHHHDLSSTFPKDEVDKWDRMVEEWNMDPKKTNPYDEAVTGTYLQFLEALDSNY